MLALDERRWRQLTTLLFFVSLVPLTNGIFSRIAGDIPVYESVAREWRAGLLPYAQHRFEYPPYSLLWFMPPTLAGSARGYRIFFECEMWIAAAAIRALVWRFGVRTAKDWRMLLPLASIFFSDLCGDYLLLRRFDVVPALFALLAVLAMSRGKPMASGLALAIGVGAKLYPAVLAPLLLVAAWREKNVTRFIAGGVLGILPLLLSSFYFPWWQFAAFHNDRGLQVESLFGAPLWLAHFFGAPVAWVLHGTYFDSDGPWSAAILPFAKVLFLVTASVSALWVTWRARVGVLDAPRLARLSIIAVTGFIVCNTVLSPQYLLWVAPFLALAVLRDGRVLVPLYLAILCAPLFFPAPDYFSGLDVWRSTAVVVRNVTLLVGFVAVIRRELSPDTP